MGQDGNANEMSSSSASTSDPPRSNLRAREVSAMTTDLSRLLLIAGGVGLLVANAIWLAHRIPWRRIVLGNVLLLVASYFALAADGCGGRFPPRSTKILTHNEKGGGQVAGRTSSSPACL
jgi:hypothetical protein